MSPIIEITGRSGFASFTPRPHEKEKPTRPKSRGVNRDLRGGGSIENNIMKFETNRYENELSKPLIYKTEIYLPIEFMLEEQMS